MNNSLKGTVSQFPAFRDRFHFSQFDFSLSRSERCGILRERIRMNRSSRDCFERRKKHFLLPF